MSGRESERVIFLVKRQGSSQVGLDQKPRFVGRAYAA